MTKDELLAQAGPPNPEAAIAPRQPAEVFAFPISRHTVVEKLARRLVRYDTKRAAFFLRQEASKLAIKRLESGIPEDTVASDSAALETAVWGRMRFLKQQGSDAA
jgi:hypothetical protein